MLRSISCRFCVLSIDLVDGEALQAHAQLVASLHGLMEM
jgi:hypothetical protein